MKPGAPWSIKGVDPESRELAKARAREAGMTLGQWLNATISKADPNSAGGAQPSTATHHNTSALDTARVLRAVAEVARRVDTLQAEQAGTTDQSNQLSHLEGTLAEISARVDEISLRPAPTPPAPDTSRLEQQISALAAKVDEVQRRPNPAPDLSALDTAISALNNRVERLAGSISSAAPENPELLAAMERMTTRMDALDSGQADAKSGGDDELHATLNKVTEKLEVLSEAAKRPSPAPSLGHNNDPEQAAAAEAALDEQGKNIVKLMNGMVNIAAKVDAVQTDLDDRIAPLDKTLTELRAELARSEQALSERIAPVEQALTDVRQSTHEQAQDNANAIASLDNALQHLTEQQIVHFSQQQTQATSQAPQEPEPEPEQPTVRQQEPEPAPLPVQEPVAEPDPPVPVLPETSPIVTEQPAPEHTAAPQPPRFDDLASRPEPNRQSPNLAASQVFSDPQAPEQQPPSSGGNDAYDQPERPSVTLPVSELLNRQEPVAQAPAAEQQPVEEPVQEPQAAPPAVELPTEAPEPAPSRLPEQPPYDPANDPDLAGLQADPHLSAVQNNRDPRNAPYMRGDYHEPRFRFLKAASLLLFGGAAIVFAIFIAFEELGAPKASDSPTLLNRITTQIDKLLAPAADDGSQPEEENTPAEATEDGSTSEQSSLPAQENQDSAPAEQPTIQPVTEDTQQGGNNAVADTGQSTADQPASTEPVKGTETAAPDSNASTLLTAPTTDPATESQPETNTELAKADPTAPPALPAATQQETALAQSVEQAAENGDPDAQFAMGERYKNGDGVAANYQSAAGWFERAAAAGNTLAQYNLGVMNRQGLGVPKDLPTAQKWLQMAAEANHPQSQKLLAEVYAQDDRGTPDYYAAAQWFERAASQGIVDAQFNVGVMYNGGLGVEPDQIAAYRWFGIAARSGDQESKREQTKISASLDAATRNALDQEIAGWQPQLLWKAPQNPWLTKGSDNNADDTTPLVRRDQIKELQQLLLSYGYDPGKPDGLPGSRTSRAIRDWQRDNNLLVDGQLTAKLLKQLKERQ